MLCHSPQSYHCLFFSILVDAAEVGTENKLLAVGGENGIVAICDLFARKTLRQAKLDSGINCITFLSRDLCVAGCENGSSVVLNVENLKKRHVFHDSDSPVMSLMPGPAGKSGFFAGKQVMVAIELSRFIGSWAGMLSHKFKLQV